MSAGNSGSITFSKILRNIVLILFMVVFASIAYNFRNRESATESALMTDATDSTSFRGVFIRSEQVVSYSGNGVVSYSVPDGGRLGTGSVIAQVYQTDEQIINNREVEKLTNELAILNKIQNPGTLESAQPSELSADIEEAYRNIIYSRDTRDYEAIGDAMDDLLVLLSTYQIVTHEEVDFSARVTDITSRLTQLRSTTIAPTEILTSESSAYFVSYCDGYEETLTKENIDSLTIDQLKEISNNKDDSANIVGKLIDGYEWYLAGIVDNSKKTYVPGDKVSLHFESTAELFDAEVVSVRDEGDPSESIIVVSCKQFNYDLVQHRCEEVDLVKGSYTGLKVPREAIRFLPMEEEVVDEETGITSIVTKNYKGVYILEGEQVEFKKLDVIYEGSDYVLSDVHEEDSSYLALYDDIMLEGGDSNG
ncbi:MAG: hypothetical protein IJX77_08830 [Ruminococcus sp.]|nr:hypothetical protein [Ruminococcus sp.]